MMTHLPLKKIIPAGILATLLLIAWLVSNNPPEAQRKKPNNSPRLSVETITVAPQTYRVALSSYGTVTPRTQSSLIAQVSGMITRTNPVFRDGGFFKRGDVLLEIDSRDYLADVQIAEAAHLTAQQQLAEEHARSDQALVDWQQLGNDGDAPDLVLRKPQLFASEASLKAAEATLNKTILKFERTRITAPYDGRVLKQYVDIGQVVNGNMTLADIYATDYVEVRLPIRNSDLDFIDLPETDTTTSAPHKVAIRSSLSQHRRWEGRVIRTEGAIDDIARQLHVIAQINAPFNSDSSASHSGTAPIKIGEYVMATIQGKQLSDTIVIPNHTIYQGTYVYIVENDALQRRNITIAWQNNEDAIIREGLSAGDTLVTTTLGLVTSGVRVTTRNVGPKVEFREPEPQQATATSPQQASEQ